MPRPSKPPGEHAVPFSITLDPAELADLDAIMAEDGETKRSRAIAQLVTEERRRRARRSVKPRRS
jgi:metal-responsive CopG/Arc/MetJ family transcriptional regulator